MKRNRVFALMTVIVLLFAAGCSSAPAPAPSAAEAAAAPAEATTEAAAESAAAPAATETDWPNKAIQVFIPASAGGQLFVDCNKITSMMTEELGVPFVVNAMPGAGGTVGMRHVKDSPADGYTMMFCQSGVFSTYAMGVADFDYTAYELGGIAIEDNVTCIFADPEEFPTFQSLIDYSAENPSEVVWGTVMGGLTHLLGLSLTNELGIEWTVADFGDVAETTAAIMSGDCDISMTSIPSLIPYMESGDLQPLVIFGKERSPAYPDVPTVSEFAADINFTKLMGLYFPKDTDPAIVQKFNDTLEKIVTSDDFQTYCAEYFVDGKFHGGEDGAALLAEQQVFFKDAVAQMEQ